MLSNSVCVNVCVQMYAYTYTHESYTYTHTHMNHTHTHIHTYTHVHVCLYVYVCACACVSVAPLCVRCISYSLTYQLFISVKLLASHRYKHISDSLQLLLHMLLSPRDLCFIRQWFQVQCCVS